MIEHLAGDDSVDDSELADHCGTLPELLKLRHGSTFFLALRSSADHVTSEPRCAPVK